MSVRIRQSDLRNDNAAVMRRVAAGESFIVTVNGRAVADVVPHHTDSQRRRFVPVSELIAAIAASPIADAHSWHADTRAGDDVFGADDINDPYASR